MRILIFSQHFWPESFRINDIAQWLLAAGHQVTVLTGQPNYPSGEIFPGYRAAGQGVEWREGLRIERVPLFPRGSGGALRLVLNYVSFIASSALFGPWRLRGQRFDVVFVYATSPLVQALGAWVLARLKGCASVVWVQDLWPESLQATGYVRNQLALAAVARVVRFIYARQERVLVQSEAFVPRVRALSPEWVPVVALENPSEAEADLETPTAVPLPVGFVVVFAGNLGQAQALDAVLDAAERLRDRPELQIVLLGSGSRSAWLAEQVERRSLSNVHLPGRVEPEAVGPILHRADALLVSLANDDALALTVPSKVQTYLAAGRPIVAALNGEGARIVQAAGAGLCCAPEGPALAATLEQLMALEPAIRSVMGNAGRAYHDAHFAPPRFLQRLVAELQLACNSRRE